MNSRLSRVWDLESLARSGNYSPAGIAQLSGVSVRQTERFFMHTYGKSPRDWSHALRLADAVKLLAQGKWVKEVAAELGYYDAAHFIRDFKQYYGVTPGRWNAQYPIQDSTLTNLSAAQIRPNQST